MFVNINNRSEVSYHGEFIDKVSGYPFGNKVVSGHSL
jgi:hypothetical protein